MHVRTDQFQQWLTSGIVLEDGMVRMCCDGLLHRVWVAAPTELEIFQPWEMADSGDELHALESPSYLLQPRCCSTLEDDVGDVGALDDEKFEAWEFFLSKSDLHFGVGHLSEPKASQATEFAEGSYGMACQGGVTQGYLGKLVELCDPWRQPTSCEAADVQALKNLGR